MADFNVKCNECNAPLDADFYNNELFVQPCDACLETVKDEGRVEGYEERDIEEAL